MSDNNSNVSQRVRVALQKAMGRIKELESKQREPIAVVGMACRFPGSPTIDAYWDTLVNRKDMIREVPDERLLGPWPQGVPRWAGLLDDVTGFDAGFFGISPREALSLDPQQRLLLEVAWEALENSCLVPAKLFGTNTGVFVGMCSSDYRDRALDRPDAERSAYDTTGNMASTAAGRISYVLGLQGPAMTVDTACSSSLVTVHLACQSLRAGESDLALAGGVNLILSEETTHALSFTQALSPDGRCKAFDASANGFVRGEGCGLIVLKRLSDAQRDNDTILGLIRGSAINQDGRSSGLTAPNVSAQETLLRDALAHAGLEPEVISYIECHGTGTSLGDPIEIEAIKSVFGAPRADGSKVWLGAVKTNIGHLEGAAGIAGIIKILLAFKHGEIPANLHLRRINPRIKLSGTPLTPVTESMTWAPTGGRRIAGVSSFGMSGTNAHLILEAPATASTPHNARPAQPPIPLLLSAQSTAAVREQALRLQAHLAKSEGVSVRDIGFSLATARTHFEHRSFVLADEIPEALSRLATNAATSPRIIRTGSAPGKLAFLFTGQGAQRPCMGMDLHAAFSDFRDAFDAICATFDKHLEMPLASVIFAAAGTPNAELLDQTSYTQAALFTLEVALWHLLASFGVKPDILLGHSIGELAAAHVAGVFSLDDACKLVAARGRLMQALPPGGAMVSLQASEQEVLRLLGEFPDVDIAGLNGPMSTVIAGAEQPVLECARCFESQGRKVKRLTVSHAFHSRLMDGMLRDYAHVAASITYHSPRVSIISNVTGGLADKELCSPEYWVSHARSAVRFADGVRMLESFAPGAILELGPDAVLSGMASACLSESDQKIILPVLRKNQSEQISFVSALATLHCQGTAVDWPAFFAPTEPRRVQIPSYPFQRKKFWLADGEPNFNSTSLATECIMQRNIRYEVNWKPLALAIDKFATKHESHLIVVTHANADRPFTRTLQDALKRLGSDAQVLALNPRAGQAATCEAIQESLVGQSCILSCLSLDEAPDSTYPYLPCGLTLTINLMQTIASLAPTAKLWSLTRSAVATRHDEPLQNPLQALTVGLARVFALEHPQQWGGLIDLPTNHESGELEPLCRILTTTPPGEDHFAVRAHGVFVRRIIHSSTTPVGSSYTPTGTILITGGTGALGLHCAQWLARSGAQHIVLTSRRAASSASLDKLREECRGGGVRLTTMQCDVSDAEAITRLFAELQGAGERPSAVFHAAGVPGSLTPLLKVDLDEFAEVLSAKVAGATAVDALSRETPLDAFVCFGSVSGVWGSGRQAAYSAANAYLDALASHRVGLGLAATSIAWGPWSGGGMATDEALKLLEERGLHALEPEIALAALGQSVNNNANVIVADVNWHRLKRGFAILGPRKLFDDLATAESATAPLAAEIQSLSITEELRSHPRESWTDVILRWTTEQVMQVLHLDTTLPFDHDANFATLGLDSLMAMELRDRLQRLTNLKLAATVAFDYPSSRLVTSHILELLTTKTELLESAATRPVDPALAEVTGRDSAARMISLWNSGGGARTAGPVTSETGEFLRLIRSAIVANKADAAIRLLDAFNDARPTAPVEGSCSPPMGLSDDAGLDDRPHMYCIPSLACPSSPLQFARLAPAISKVAKLWSKGNPGYGVREPLPEFSRTFSDVHTATILEHISGPIFLMGYSSGSWVAMDVAQQMSTAGRPAAGLVLLDPLSPSTKTRVGNPRALQLLFILRTVETFLNGQSIFTEGEIIYQVSSMLRAFDIYRDAWTAPPSNCPVLFVHATGGFPLGGQTILENPYEVWGDALRGGVVQPVPHDHFEMIGAEVGSTARLVSEWIDSVRVKSPDRIR